MRKKPHDLQYLEVLHQRKGLTLEEEKEYRNQLKGYAGETKVDQWCNKHLKKEIVTLDDINLKLGTSETQVDKLIAGNRVLYHIEIKNYEGHYRYENNCWSINGRILSNSPLEQSRRSVRMAQQILNEKGIYLQIVGVIMFVNDNFEIELIDNVPEIILTSEEICPWLAGIQPFNVQDWKNVFQKNQLSKHQIKYITTRERFIRLEKGIRCPRCGDLKIKKSNRNNLICRNCGYIEPKMVANTRTVCEYGLIMHHLPLKKKGIQELMGEEFNSRYLTKILHQWFDLIPNTKFHENKGVCFEEWFCDKLDLFREMYKRKNWK